MRASRSLSFGAAACVAAAGLLAACHSSTQTASVPTTSTAAAATSPAPTTAATTSPPVNGQFDYQLGGAYPPLPSVAIVDRDRHDQPATGKYNICYVNAFQTQPDEKTFWTGSHDDLLLKNAKGKYISDLDWPGEYILDTSTAANRNQLAAIEGGWIDGCAKAGFQGVEPDNLDSWTRSDGRLTMADNVAMSKLLVRRAHSDGLAIAQKNTSDLGRIGKTSIGFDFAIAEECQVYTECDAYTGPYHDHVIEIEYTDNPRRAYPKACAARGTDVSVIMRDRDVVPAGNPAYHYEYC